MHVLSMLTLLLKQYCTLLLVIVFTSTVVSATNISCYCRLEEAMLQFEGNKDNIQETFNPTNFASPDSVYVYYILNAISMPNDCSKTSFWAKTVPVPPHGYNCGKDQMMIWTRTPIFILIPPFLAAEVGLSAFPLSFNFSPFDYRTSVCVLLKNAPQDCINDSSENHLEQLTAKLSLYSVQYKAICDKDTNSVSYSFGENSNVQQDSPSHIVAQLLYGAIILLSMAYIPISLRYEQIIYDYVAAVIKRKLSISYSFVWGLVLGCILVNLLIFISKGVLTLHYIMSHPHIMEPWEDEVRVWFIVYMVLYILTPVVSQFIVALGVKKEEDVPYPGLVDRAIQLCTLFRAPSHKRGLLVQTFAIWTMGTFGHFIVLSLPFTVLEIAASPLSNLSWPAFLVFSFLGICCILAIVVTIDRICHPRDKTRTNCKETFYLCLYYLACLTISLVLAILMLVLCSMTVLDKVQTKPGVTNMITFLIAPLIVAVIGWLTKLGMQHVQINLNGDNEIKEAGENEEMQHMLDMGD